MDQNNQTHSKFTLPTIFVIFGITGDLVRKKILKALYHLYLKKYFPPRFRVYGFSRRPYSDEELKKYLLEIMKEGKFPQPKKYEEFLSAFFYIQGDFYDSNAYKKLAATLGRTDGAWTVCSNKLFYLAVPPSAYSDIITNLHKFGLTLPCSPEEGWTRVILEKPFGTDLETAKKLDIQLGSLFKEEQIYRVDHYLAKETVRNILAFRFSNTFLTPAWNSKSIEKIELKLLEENTVSTRGDFYDKVGALRDVGQNHLLQLLSLFIMDEPKEFSPKEIKKKRSEALDSIELLNKDRVSANSVRGQYEGYKLEKGVNQNSQIETYFKIRLFSNKPSFNKVPLFIESGKAMSKTLIEVIITFKHPSSFLYKLDGVPKNVLHYQLNPEEKISMRFLAKKPGFDYGLEEHELGFNYRDAYDMTAFVDDYEALLYDIIKGDQTLFVSTQEIIAQWQFIEQIVRAWEKGRPELFSYQKNTYDGHDF